MIKSCSNCLSNFEITNNDELFYKSVDAPLPTFCPDCRQKRRFAWRNERKLYKRKCDLTGENIISIYSEDKPLKVYSRDAWWGDDWDAMEYGKEFDFTRPFFPQMEELMHKVPHVTLWNWQSENSDYTHCSYANKNCYMHFNTDHSEDSFYNYMSDGLKDCIDCGSVWKGELLIECLDSENLYSCRFCQNCKNCNNLDFCNDCIGCEDCFGCINLTNKKYCAYNEQLTKENYESKFKNIELTNQFIQEVLNYQEQLFITKPRKEYKMINSENCTGNYIVNSKNAQQCFDVWDGEDIKYCTYVAGHVKNTYDTYAAAKVNNCLEVISGEGLNNSKYINWINNGPHDSEYCILCVNNCKNLFGCIGLKNKQYCIFNKQYSKEEYFSLRAKIIEHMKDTKEYGEFFPEEMSPFKYNETIAEEYFPKSQINDKSQNSKHQTSNVIAIESTCSGRGVAETSIVQNDISKDDDSICDKILTCNDSGKPYKIIPQELNLYRKLKVPIPLLCPDIRHQNRIDKRNPRKLWNRKCMKCEKDIKTTYSPERKEIVYCEECYLKEVY